MKAWQTLYLPPPWHVTNYKPDKCRTSDKYYRITSDSSIIPSLFEQTRLAPITFADSMIADLKNGRRLWMRQIEASPGKKYFHHTKRGLRVEMIFIKNTSVGHFVLNARVPPVPLVSGYTCHLGPARLSTREQRRTCSEQHPRFCDQRTWLVPRFLSPRFSGRCSN